MNKPANCLLTLALCMGLASTALASTSVRISQVYSGGGGGSGTYKNDYIELFNNANSAVAIGGWTIQYGSATGTSGFGSGTINVATIPSGASIAACSYYLIRVGTASTATTGADLPVTPDVISTTVNMGAAAGKVALVTNSTAPTACSGNSVGGVFADVVGWGAGANCYEGTALGALSSTTTGVRKTGGITDSDTNSADFDVLASSGVTIHNSSSPPNQACVTDTKRSTWGQVKTIYR